MRHKIFFFILMGVHGLAFSAGQHVKWIGGVPVHTTQDIYAWWRTTHKNKVNQLSKNEALVDAVKSNYPHSDIIALVEDKADINYCRYGLETPLSAAIDLCNTLNVLTLLLYKANVNQSLPLLYKFAHKENELTAQKKIIYHLVREKTDISRHELLHRAVICDNTELVRYLLASNAHVNRKDRYGDTPLHYGATSAGMVELLVAAKADLLATTNRGESVFESNIHTISMPQNDPRGLIFLKCKLTEARAERDKRKVSKKRHVKRVVNRIGRVIRGVHARGRDRREEKKEGEF